MQAGKMSEYIINDTVCRRKFLFEEFINYHEKDIEVKGCECCDICSKMLCLLLTL